MTAIKQRLRKLTPFQIITASFLFVILLGSALLSLPAATAGKGRCPYLDALFTSGSAVCVTGLVVHNTATYWSAFGKGVILVLIQIGGLGVITVVLTVSLFLGRRIGLRQRDVMQNAVNAPQIGGIVRLTRFIVIFTLLTEGAGAAALSPVFARQYGLAAGMRKAVFHSVSAFCNAGFDTLGDKAEYVSLTGYSGDILLNVTIMALIIIGGLGFLTWQDLIQTRFRWRKLTMQTRVILLTSALLITVPAALFFFFEFAGTGFKNRLLLSLFQSVTTRTAGFNTADFSGMSEASKLLMAFLMLVGGSPGSTAGGMKTTTFAVILLGSVGFMRRRKTVNIFQRSVEGSVITEAFTLLLLYLFMLLGGTLLISSVEKLPVLDCIFESASALGTVGLTTGITPSLGTVSKLVLIVFMYFGRVGGLTLAFAASAGTRQDAGKLPRGRIMVG